MHSGKQAPCGGTNSTKAVAASEQLSAQAAEVQRVVEELATVIGGQSLDASRRASTQQHGSLHGGHASAKTPSRKNPAKAAPNTAQSSVTAQANDPVGSDEEFMSLDGEGMKSF